MIDRSINRIELRGNVGQDPRVNQVGENTVIKFNMATNEIFKDRSGNLKQETTWHTIVAWAGKGMPDFKEIRKGVCVSVNGKLRTNRYTSIEGEEKIYFEILANRISVVDENSLQV